MFCNRSVISAGAYPETVSMNLRDRTLTFYRVQKLTEQLRRCGDDDKGGDGADDGGTAARKQKP
jgi:hypothetical protein